MPEDVLVAAHVFSAGLTGVVAWRTYHHRHVPGARWFGVAMAGVSAWALLGAMEQTITGPAPVIFSLLVRIQWIPIGIIAVGWLTFGLAYTGRGEYVTRRRVAVLSVVPAVIAIAALCHPFLIPEYAAVLGPLAPLTEPLWIVPEFWSDVSFVGTGYVYLLLAVGSAFLLEVLIERPDPNPGQLLVGLAVGPPWILNVLHMTGLLRFDSFDPTILGFTITGSVGLFAVGRFRLFDVPLARARIVEEIDGGVLVYGRDGRMYDYNRRGASLLGISSDVTGRDIRTVLAESSLDLDAFDLTHAGAGDDGCLTTRLDGETVVVEGSGSPTYIEMRVSDLRDATGAPLTRVLLLYDVSERERHRADLQAERDARKTLQAAIAETSSAEAFARAACEQLAALDAVAFAWVGSLGPNGTIDPLVDASGYLADLGSDDRVRADGVGRRETEGAGGVRDAPTEDAIDEGDESEPLPSVVAIERGETHATSITEGKETWAECAASRGATAALAVPVTHDGVTRGVLAVYLAEADVVDRIGELVAETADVVGYVLGSGARRRALAADDRVTVEVVIDTPGDPIARAVTTVGTTATVSAAVPREDDTLLSYLRVPETEAPAFEDAVRDTDGIESADRLDVVEGNARFQLVVVGPTPRTVLAEHGGDVTDQTVAPGETSVTAAFPRGTTFDPVLSALEDAFGPARVERYQSGTDPDSASRKDIAGPLASLTERQREVLEVAHRAGYFEYPREQSASEVATRLGVSRPTFQEILQAAQRNVFEAAYEDGK